ncbi:MAG: DUF533 domain-containing protein [Rhodobacter sp.]|nr:DUF533 domain-containing protein [Rhodobacter sp.]
MLNAKSLLDSLTSSLAQLTGGQGAKGLTEKAKETWNAQSTLGKGAIAGGLLGVLLTRGGRRLIGTGAKIGGAALIGGLAYKAYEDWKAGRTAGVEGGPISLPSPAGTEFLPDDPDAADDLATRILQAMIAAAKADGHVTPDERARIDAQLANLGLGDEATALITSELDAPLDVGRVAALARNEREATEIYAASLLVVDENAPAEKGYLAMLAARMQLDPGLVAHLHSKAAQLA